MINDLANTGSTTMNHVLKLHGVITSLLVIGILGFQPGTPDASLPHDETSAKVKEEGDLSIS